MFISNSMTQKVVTISNDTFLVKAREIMAEKGIRHLPVVADDNRLLGMITDRDIRSALPRDDIRRAVSDGDRAKFAELRAEDVMTTELIVIEPTYTIQDALLLFKENVVGALPVVDEKGILKGILSVRDLLRAFINVLGIGEPGTLMGILVEEKIGQLKKIVDVVTEENISFGSVLVARYWEKDKRAVFIYLLTQNVSRVKRRLKDLGHTLIDPMQWYLDQLPEPEDPEK